MYITWELLSSVFFCWVFEVKCYLLFLLHIALFWHFCSIVRRLEVTPDNIVTSFTNVVDEMFADGQYNWGRIITIYAFAGWLARYCCCGRACDASSVSKVCNCDPEPAKQMAACAGDYVARRLSTWVRKQGGWVSCWKYYHFLWQYSRWYTCCSFECFSYATLTSQDD